MVNLSGLNAGMWCPSGDFLSFLICVSKAMIRQITGLSSFYDGETTTNLTKSKDRQPQTRVKWTLGILSNDDGSPKEMDSVVKNEFS